jgi:hypothetical protein
MRGSESKRRMGAKLKNAEPAVEIVSGNTQSGQELPEPRERTRKNRPPFGEFLPRARVGKLLTVTDWLREYGKVYRAVRRGHICTQDGSRLAYMCVSGKSMAEAVEQLRELAALREQVEALRRERGGFAVITQQPDAPPALEAP